MSTIGLVTGVALGPWRLPQRAQTALIQMWAEQNKWTIDFIVSEFVFSRAHPQLCQAVGRDTGDGPTRIVLATAYQVSSEPAERAAFLAALDGCELTFALEGELFRLPEAEHRAGSKLTQFFAELDRIAALPQLSHQAALVQFPRPNGKDDVGA